MLKKVLIAGTLAGGLLFALLLILLLTNFDSPRLGKAALDRASSATGVQLHAKAFRLNLLRGLVLEGVEAAATAPVHAEVHLDRLVFQHRWLPLLTGRVAVDRVLVDGLRLKVSLPSAARGASAAPARARPTPAQGAAALAVEVSEVALRRASMEVFTEGQKQPTATLKGLDLLLRNLDLEPGAEGVAAALSGEGNLRIEEIAFATTHVRDVQGELNLRKGHLEVRGARFTTEEGRFEAGFTAELARTPLRYTLTLKGDLDINASAGAGKGGGFGPGSLDMKGEGEGVESTGLKGTGVFKLAAGRLPATPLLAGIEKALGRTSLAGSPYKATQTTFRAENDRISFDRFPIESEKLALDCEGWSSMEGAIGMSLIVRTPRQGLRIAGVPDEVFDGLTDEKGWVAIPLKVTGTELQPRVLPDTEALMGEARKGAKKALEKKAAGRLKDLFKR
ncbi:MAG TPA: hypothetical protein VN461_21800 [Vicinamibacteria bacterium]|jgi:hypothetical protein|nr:hypothetical protein [Vicinamibacteria bacterium]